MVINRFTQYAKSLWSQARLPKDFFDERYDAQTFYRQSRERRRSDLFDLPTADSSQDYCDTLSKDIKSLLREDERQATGDFYVGLSDEALLSCTVEPMENSFLIIIHRRLFNALRFLSAIYISSTLSVEEKIILLSEYIFAITSENAFLDDIPSAPSMHTRKEAEELALLEGNLLRFLIGHEVSHMLPSSAVDLDMSSLPSEKRMIWIKECQADYYAVSLMLRNEIGDTHVQQRYRTAAVQASILFLTFLSTIERLRLGVFSVANTNQSHPNALLRDVTLSANLTKYHPDLTDLLQYTHAIVHPLFEKIEDYISQHMVYRRAA